MSITFDAKTNVGEPGAGTAPAPWLGLVLRVAAAGAAAGRNVATP